MIDAYYQPTLISNSAKKLNQGTDIKFSVTLTDPTQVIACHVSCDEFGMAHLTLYTLQLTWNNSWHPPHCDAGT